MDTKQELTAVPKPEPTAAKAPPRERAARPRRVAAGDIAPVITADGIEAYSVQEAVAAAQESKVVALRDIVTVASRGDASALAKTLEAILAGASPEDAALLRNVLLKEPEPVAPKLPVSPDDELADDWRDGGYPYRNLMSRKNYEKQKYRLQVELLKLQAWVKETGQKVVILFEGRDA
ncbi:MAG: polyphosphate kinase 2, family, partial [Proteobacteria bacterium]|nr:polyphosphate kinase 2, family [Pseudomonadota bacterium]